MVWPATWNGDREEEKVEEEERNQNLFEVYTSSGIKVQLKDFFLSSFSALLLTTIAARTLQFICNFCKNLLSRPFVSKLCLLGDKISWYE